MGGLAAALLALAHFETRGLLAAIVLVAPFLLPVPWALAGAAVAAGAAAWGLRGFRRAAHGLRRGPWRREIVC